MPARKAYVGDGVYVEFDDQGGFTYRIKDADGNELPLGFQYDTRPGGLRGFTLPGIEKPMTWAELRKAWPAWVKEHGEER